MTIVQPTKFGSLNDEDFFTTKVRTFHTYTIATVTKFTALLLVFMFDCTQLTFWNIRKLLEEYSYLQIVTIQFKDRI